jgi:hypothetical protein
LAGVPVLCDEFPPEDCGPEGLQACGLPVPCEPVADPEGCGVECDPEAIDECAPSPEGCDPTGLPTGCGPFLQAILSRVIPNCPTTPLVPGVNAYVCFGTGSGPITGAFGLRTLVIGRPTGGTTTL